MTVENPRGGRAEWRDPDAGDEVELSLRDALAACERPAVRRQIREALQLCEGER